MRQLQLRCPNPQCRLTLTIPADALGQRVKCASCGYAFIVPVVRVTTPTKAKRKAS